MSFETKEEIDAVIGQQDIEKIIGQVQLLVSKINSLIVTIGNFDVVKFGPGLYTYLLSIKTVLSEARDSLSDQVPFYIDLLNQFDKDVKKAKKTFGKIKVIEHDIIISKGRLNFKLTVWSQMMIVYGKELSLPDKDILVEVKNNLDLISQELPLSFEENLVEIKNNLELVFH